MDIAELINKARVTLPGQSEALTQRLYDWLLYPAAGSPRLSFFSQAVGQGVTTALGGVVGTPKSQHDTNLEMANTLPSGKTYIVESIEVQYLPGASATANTYTPASVTLFNAVAAANVMAQLQDVNLFYQGGLLEFNILSKNYLREAPMMAFPPKTSLEVNAGVASNSATTSEVAAVWGRAVGRAYILAQPLLLQPAMNFEVNISYPAPVATNSGFNGRVGVILDGTLVRASQ